MKEKEEKLFMAFRGKAKMKFTPIVFISCTAGDGQSDSFDTNFGALINIEMLVLIVLHNFLEFFFSLGPIKPSTLVTVIF